MNAIGDAANPRRAPALA